MTIRPVSIDIAPSVADPNGICAAQTTGGAGNLTINGVLASGGVATLPIAGHVSITSTGNLSSLTFTVYGTLRNGVSASEAVTGPNNSTVVTSLNFKTVIQVAVSGTVGTNVEVGTANSLDGPWVVLERHDTSGHACHIHKSSDANFTFDVETTGDNVFAVGEAGAEGIAEGLEATELSKFIEPGAFAVRLILTAYVAGSARFTVSGA